MYNRKYWGNNASQETKQTSEVKFEVIQVESTKETEPITPTKKTAENQKKTNQNSPKGKSKIAAGLFGIFLGYFGIHNFYLSYTGKGLAQLLLSTVGLCFTCGFSIVFAAIWGLIEGILILTGSINKDANGVPLVD